MSVILKYEPVVWLNWTKARDAEDFLTVDARQIIGILYSVKHPSPELIAEALDIPQSIVQELLTEIMTSENVVIRSALKNGLSLDGAVDLPERGEGGYSLYCKRCRQCLSTVPCCKCLIRAQRQTKTTDDSESTKELPECGEPTKARPGSYEKLLVMQQRLKQGYSAFCRGDRKTAARPLPPKMRPVALRRKGYLNAIAEPF